MGRTYKYEKSWGKPKKKNKRNAKQGSQKGKRSVPKQTARPDEDFSYQESFERFDRK